MKQIGRPPGADPENLFVAQFVGSPVMNVAEATVAETGGQAAVTVEGAPDLMGFTGKAPGHRPQFAGRIMCAGMYPSARGV